MAINVIVQYNGGFLPDILLLTQARHKRFFAETEFSPDCAVRFTGAVFFMVRWHYYRILLLDYPFNYVCMYCHTYNKIMDQPGKVPNPARGQLKREN